MYTQGLYHPAPSTPRAVTHPAKLAGVLRAAIGPASLARQLVERFVSPFQVKLLVAGKVEAHRAAVQMVWDAG
jgi:hypothetical protein